LLEIFKLQQNKPVINIPKNEGNYKGIIKYYSPSTKEWFNSIYVYNKNYNKLLPIADNIIIKLIRGYFNMYTFKLNNKVRISNISNKKRKLSSKKIWVSKPELKHTGDKVIINLFVYDRNRKIFNIENEKYIKYYI